MFRPSLAMLKLLCSLLLLSSTGHAAAPDQPYLRLETGMHTAPIRRIAVDAAERYLVTASDDKTARVWDLTRGRLLQILRPPLGDGAEGKLYAVAITPNGAEVAVAGYTTQNGSSDVHIYFFDTASGRLLRQIGQLPEAIKHLAYSFDGVYLAAALGRTGGIRVYDAAQTRLLASDSDYADGSYWVEFDRAGHLVSSSWDGYIRLYDAQFQLLQKRALPGGKRPFAVRFSPDGHQLAVGFDDSTAINLLAADTLELRYAPDTHGINNGNLGRVAWSADGQALYAGGRYADSSGNVLVLRWSQAGRGAYRASSAANNTVMDIRSLRSDRLLYGAGDPAWAVLDSNGNKNLEHTPAIIDHRKSSPSKLRLSADAASVEFIVNARPQQFSLLNPAEARLDLVGAKTSAQGLDIKDWEDKLTPKLNGKALVLQPYETSRSLAISADDRHFLLGTEWLLRFYDALGQQQWQTATGAVVWAVNLSRDQRFAVAALADGTIRWYRLRDGKEQLAYFPVNQGQDWVVWTPEGFFNASAKGKELIGYHLNQGQDKEGQFVQVSQLYEQFYRPDLIAQRLQQSDDAEKLIQQAVANIGDVRDVLQAGLPPKLELLSEPESRQTSRDYTLRFKVSDKADAVQQFVYKINGKTFQDRAWSSSLIPGYDPVERHFTLAPGVNRIEVIAKNAKQVASLPISATVRVDLPQQPEVNLYVLALGVSNYRDHKLKLNFADKDASALAEELRLRGQGLFKQVIISPPLLNEQATLARIEQAFDALADRVQPQDVFVLYLAGHGKTVDGRYHFIPWELVYEGKATLLNDSLNQTRLTNWLSRIRAQKSVVLLDTCDSGSFTTAAVGARGLEEQTAIDHLISATGSAVLMAAGNEQMALEGYQDHGVFTYALLEGLRNADNNHNRQVEIDELAFYIKDRVPEITKQQWGYEQFTRRDLKGMSFPLGLVGEQ